MHSLPGVTSKGDLELAELRQTRGQEPARPQSESAEASFGDVLDIVNPLQHIPGVASVYRNITGDEISGHAQVLGSTLYGGPLGMLAGSLSAAITEESGKSLPGTLAAAFTGESAGAQTTKTAAAAQAGGDSAETASAGAAQQGGGTDEAARAATAALPNGINAVLPAAPATAGNGTGDNGGQQAGANAAAQAANATNGGEVLQGRQALAAFARDKAAADNAGNNGTGRSQAETNDPSDSRAEEAGGRRPSAGDRAANLDRQQNFMQLRESDYATSAEMRARTQHLDEYQAQAANEVSPRVDSNSSATHADAASNGSRQRGLQPSGAPDDFASRMKEALAKYRAMHENQ